MLTRSVGRRLWPVLAGLLLSAVLPGGGTAAGAGDGQGVDVVIAGDIATCTGDGDAQTAALVADLPGIVMTAGDNVYPVSTATALRDCYDPTWGRFLRRTRPAIGNHDMATPGADAYFDHFGWRAGPRGRGWYAFDAGTWRIYVLDSQPCFTGPKRRSGCGSGSPQHRWLSEDLAANPRACVMAVAHHPRFSSGPHGNTVRTWPLLGLLLRAGAELIVNGHDHIYERFARARPDGTRDDRFGMRQFIVGTGGGGLYALDTVPAPNSEVRDGGRYGVLTLRLMPGAYTWRFVPVSGPAGDRGAEPCHGVPGSPVPAQIGPVPVEIPDLVPISRRRDALVPG